MATTRNAIMTAIAEALAEVDGLDAERVHRGRPLRAFLGAAGGKPVCCVWIDSDRGGRCEGQVRRNMRVEVALLCVVDELAPDTQEHQLDEVYGLVHAAMETAAATFLSGLALNVSEAEPGIEFGGLDDQDLVTFAGCRWVIEYQRPRGAP